MADLESYPSYMSIFFTQKDGNIERIANKFENVPIFLNAFLTITATLGNGMVIVAILRSQNLQTPSYLLITSLAFTDLLVGLVNHPLQIALFISYIYTDVRAVFYEVLAYLVINTFLSAVSLIMMTCIAIDRYLALKLKHRYRVLVTKKRARLVVVIAWTFVLLVTALITYRSRLDAIFYASTSCIFFLPLSVTCGFYIKIIKALHLYTVQVQAQQPNPLAGNFDVVRYKKTLKTMLVVLGCFLLCSVPITCAMIATAIVGFSKEMAWLLVIGVVIFGLNTSTNPVIYVIRFPDIRNACRQMLRIGN